MPPPAVRTSPDRLRARPRGPARARARALAPLALLGAGAANAALLPDFAERRVRPGETLELAVAAGEPDASVFIERAPVGVELEPDGPDRWTLRWDTPSRLGRRTVVRLGAVDPRDRSRRESRELVIVRDDRAAPADARGGPVGARDDEARGANALEIPPIPVRRLVAGRAWRLSVPVRDAATGALASATLELLGAPRGMTATPAEPGWHELAWTPAPSAAGTRTVELVASAADDPTRRARRRLRLEVRSAVVEVPAATRVPEPPAAARAAPELAPLPHHVVNAGQDVAFRVETLGEGAARLNIDRLPRGARFDANADGSGTFYWPTGDRDQGEHRFRFTATDPSDPSLSDSADVLVIVGDPSRARTVPAGDPAAGAPLR